MANDPQNALIVGVSRGIRAGQHIFGVENVEALVLHRAHVEIADRHDHVQIQVIFQPEALLIPGHGLLERIHGVVALVDIRRFHINPQRRPASGAGGEGIFNKLEMPGD